MRLLELPHTTSFQLALRFLVLFGAASFGLFAFLYWQTADYVTDRVDDWLRREQTYFRLSDRGDLQQRLAVHDR